MLEPRLVTMLASSSYWIRPRSSFALAGRALSKFHKYSRLFKAYDLIRTKSAPLPLGEGRQQSRIDVVVVKLWLRAYPWLGSAIHS